MDLAIDLVDDISDKCGTPKEKIWDDILDYLRYDNLPTKFTYISFRYSYPLNDDTAKIVMLNANPPTSQKMKFHVPASGPWLLRLRSNPCHQFHGNDSIQIGIVKEQLENLVIKIKIQMEGHKFKTLTACERHQTKFHSKVGLRDSRL